MSSEEKYFSPSEVADKLGISAATLRKYSLIVEEAAGGDDYFVRNNQKARLYTEKNIADLKKLQSESKQGEKTLKEIAREIFDAPNIIAQEQPDTLNETNSELIKTLQQMQETMLQQNKVIQELNQKVNELEQNPPAGNISQPKNIVSEIDFDDDLPDMEELKKAQEEMNPNVDARSEIMRKSLENAEKGVTSDTPRTLADMQLPKEKNHWWNRFTE